ncbi:Ragulator complex protein LAMTOR2 homolog [Caenorhabditis elegans]|uniref:Ragulator complex protein LAMTOR2 homolog n=1 Tax=Caenorhabditis elegans TaxID=6239 RepID=LTOR2_CAEEL|nr:Ragulator complex protein LAMTOR2 homolog [Caenorhabditis elegans]Q9N2U6.1 RecName: Full=Ragulator complex protein LAMTOR2 homolog; AltName: Full=Late endosomal/lysosomal adapter and MAPK and MTOR activator 1 [Caenorhabditis elegans]CCD71184.1 Ragulator complex protein LAMTOR2 homolog [Caenorhabditis elegans]|eukprot:NP_505061.1 Ragulator complex protein LAMTOR2 homolog [Caenorhabditis elegans]
MLKQKALVDVLGQVNTSGVDGSWLFNKEGLLLAYVGSEQKAVASNVSSALIASVWAALERRANDLKETILVLENGVIGCTLVARTMLLAVKADKSADLGMVRAKLHTLAAYLEQPILSISHDLG